MADISVKLFDMTLKNPVMPAAGPPIKDAEMAKKAKEGGTGAIVTKTISTEAAEVPRPNMAQTRGGFMNTELWSEMGPEHWLKNEYPEIKNLGLPVIVGLGYSAEQINELVQKTDPYADAFELSTHYLGSDTSPVVESIKAAKKATDKPVMVKLSPQIDIPKFAKAAEDAGADGLVLINSFGPTLDFNIDSGKPLMGSEDGYGWLSGEAIFPLALRAVFQAVKTVEIPVLAVGGISTGEDAVKMIMAGAQAVQTCTAAILKGPKIYGKIAAEIDQYLEEHGYDNLDQIRGLAQKKAPEKANYKTKVPEIIRENCTGCRLCITSCVYDANYLDDDNKIVIEAAKCAGCGLCVTRCNFDALKLA
ncbi:dihydroorotate dehydrogenase subfamily 1 [Halanaerobium saccharolyticum]|jgi:dihydroorotate dehydrogenase subfamily 1|uniref:Dihydroorotate dehydrogenase B (NAD(+)), catalytic subunit n=1 Tax=Halanaerobium saccharolyticum TaxID=43595 RepID=A0A2T5RQI2_9FIRM|nr:alpha-hydroxy-acid oxidizing protein [Halanaerobium saccharolyticum]PTW02207.1 dihydroorotate dehydrogenase subfamily 1 [Halanaerobium saccharolyticum]